MTGPVDPEGVRVLLRWRRGLGAEVPGGRRDCHGAESVAARAVLLGGCYEPRDGCNIDCNTSNDGSGAACAKRRPVPRLRVTATPRRAPSAAPHGIADPPEVAAETAPAQPRLTAGLGLPLTRTDSARSLGSCPAPPGGRTAASHARMRHGVERRVVRRAHRTLSRRPRSTSSQGGGGGAPPPPPRTQAARRRRPAAAAAALFNGGKGAPSARPGGGSRPRNVARRVMGLARVASESAPLAAGSAWFSSHCHGSESLPRLRVTATAPSHCHGSESLPRLRVAATAPSHCHGSESLPRLRVTATAPSRCHGSESRARFPVTDTAHGRALRGSAAVGCAPPPARR